MLKKRLSGRGMGFLLVMLAVSTLFLAAGCQTAAPAPPAATATAAPTVRAATATTAPPPPAATATTAPPPPAGGDPARGQQVFTSTCNACHPGGQQGLGPSLIGMAGRLSDAQITQIVRQGRGGMPAAGAGLTDQQVADLVAYLRTLR